MKAQNKAIQYLQNHQASFAFLVLLLLTALPFPAQGLVLTNLLVLSNPGFETYEPTSGGVPSSLGNWAGDYSSVLLRPDQGISPRSGRGMLKFLGTAAAGPSAGSDSSQMWQLIDVASLRHYFSKGEVTVTVSCFFNRITGNPQTDTAFIVSLKAHSGSPSIFRNDSRILARSPSASIATDSNPGTWELVSTSLVVPPETSYLNLQIYAYENVRNDASLPEYDGHYVDDVSIQVRFKRFFNGVELFASRSGKEVTLSWPRIPGYAFVLQESQALWPWASSWSYAASGRTNPVTLSLDPPARFFRLKEVSPLEIIDQPQSQTVKLGTIVPFRITAVGMGSVRYQWNHNGSPVPEATNSSLVITNVQSVHEGNYRVIVTDDFGSVTSDTATLTVLQE